MPLMHEFAVLVQVNGEAAPRSVVWPATSEEAVRRKFGATGTVVGVEARKAVIDWDRGTYNKEEAAEYLRCSVATVERFMAEGKLPKSRSGENPIFTRAMLERVIANRMTEVSA